MSRTRLRVLRFLEAAEQPVTIAAVSVALAVGENTVRHHLSALERQGLAVSEIRREGRPGRPHLVFRTQPAPGGPYERLSLALLRARATGESLEQAGEAVAPAGDDVMAFLAAEGFNPQPEGDGAVLASCPLAGAVAADPAAVCAVHRGLVRAIADRAGHAATLLAAQPGRCRVVLAGSDRGSAGHNSSSRSSN